MSIVNFFVDFIALDFIVPRICLPLSQARNKGYKLLNLYIPIKNMTIMKNIRYMQSRRLNQHALSTITCQPYPITMGIQF